MSPNRTLTTILSCHILRGNLNRGCDSQAVWTSDDAPDKQTYGCFRPGMPVALRLLYGVAAMALRIAIRRSRNAMTALLFSENRPLFGQDSTAICEKQVSKRESYFLSAPCCASIRLRSAGHDLSTIERFCRWDSGVSELCSELRWPRQAGLRTSAAAGIAGLVA